MVDRFRQGAGVTASGIPQGPVDRRAVAGFLAVALATTTAVGMAAPPSSPLPTAATYSVNPTRVSLRPGQTSAMLTLRNEGPATIRFQLSLFSWGESASGEMQLEPSTDLVFFPSLFALEPGEERGVRIGGAATEISRERTYRIFIEELPSLTLDLASTGPSVRVLTRTGVPVFVEPLRPAPDPAVTADLASDGRLMVDVANKGNAHARLSTIQVKGIDGAGRGVFGESRDGWYVLAGGHRVFEIPLPQDACGTVRALEAEVTFEHLPVVATRVVTPAGACRP
jgi:fimbrial chaperone protein